MCVCELIEDLGVEQSNLSQHLSILRKQHIITSTKVGLKVMYRVKYPEVLTILENVQKILALQFQEGEALMRHLAPASRRCLRIQGVNTKHETVAHSRFAYWKTNKRVQHDRGSEIYFAGNLTPR